EKAHLAEIVEAVLVDDGDTRPVLLERVHPLGLRCREHGIEEGHVVPALPHARRGIQGAERGIRLLGGPQLRVEPQEIGLTEQTATTQGATDCGDPRAAACVGTTAEAAASGRSSTNSGVFAVLAGPEIVCRYTSSVSCAARCHEKTRALR